MRTPVHPNGDRRCDHAPAVPLRQLGQLRCAVGFSCRFDVEQSKHPDHDIGVYLDLAASLARDTNAAVIGAIANRLTAIGEDIPAAADRPRYERWIRTTFGPVLTSVGLPGTAGDTDEQHTRRAELLMQLRYSAELVTYLENL